MKTRYVPRPLQMLVLVGAAAIGTRAAAAVATPTLVRFEVSPLDHATPLTVALDSCTTLIKAGRLAEADAACAQAIRAAQTERAQSRTWVVSDRPYLGLAAAYNNRAVLHYLQGNLTEAAADSSRALNVAQTPALASTAAFIEAKLHRTAGVIQ